LEKVLRLLVIDEFRISAVNDLGFAGGIHIFSQGGVCRAVRNIHNGFRQKRRLAAGVVILGDPAWGLAWEASAVEPRLEPMSFSWKWKHRN
jgi:hypothetical protein